MNTYFDKLADVMVKFYSSGIGKFLAWCALGLYWPAVILFLFSFWFGISVAFESSTIQYLVFFAILFLLTVLWVTSFIFVRSPNRSSFKRAFWMGFVLIITAFILQNLVIAQFVAHQDRFGRVLDNYLR